MFDLKRASSGSNELGAVVMQEFLKITKRFLSNRPICESICVFNDILREEQIERNAHISCLPFEVVFQIMYMVEGSTINIHRNIHKYLNVIGKDQISIMREHSQMLSKRWLKLKEACRSLIEINIDEFPIMILAQTDTPAPAHTGTNLGRHILCILEENHQQVFRKQDKSLYEFKICEHAAAELDQDMNVSAHKCALVVKNRQNPFNGVEEFVSVQIYNNVRKIWWVDYSDSFYSRITTD